jgi:hypothetical protein
VEGCSDAYVWPFKVQVFGWLVGLNLPVEVIGHF